ncbi:hypothetical protein ABPG74_002124 [Tetrahymena malaccensis]
MNTTQDISPLRNRSYSPVISPQKNTIQMQSYSKPVSVFTNNSYVQVTPPRATNVHIATPSTAQTLYSINGSAPTRFNQALDQVCLLGHEMDVMRKNFELVQVELQQWKEKCSLIKAIASTPPPGTNYSPTRVSKLRNDVQNQFNNYQVEINKLNSIISNVNNELMISAEKIKALERRVGEMNKIELEMLNAKKQALELDNRNRYQAMELSDLKSKIDTKSQQNDDLVKQLMIIPQLKDQVSILELENKKLISIIQQKDDQQNRSDQKHMQLTKMYQENLEKSNEIVNQLRDLQNENEDLQNELEKVNSLADSISNSNIRNSNYLQKSRGRMSGEMSFNGEELKNSQNLKRSNGALNQSKSQQAKMKLSSIQTAIIDQQTMIDQLQGSVRDKDTKANILSKEKENLLSQIQDQMSEIQQLRSEINQQREDHDEKIKKSRRDFNEQFTNAITPLQKENEQMHSEIERLQQEIQQNLQLIQDLEQDRDSTQNQLNLERQQNLNTQQKIIKDNEIKCEALTERIIKKENELNEELIKNKELFEDNKLMAEEMRILKQKASELEVWKNKYRELKKETKALRQQFDEYKQSFIREIQNRFSNDCEQFEQCLQMIDERFDSTRHSNNAFINSSNSNEVENHVPYFQSPYKNMKDSEVQGRSSSPTQEKLKAMKQTPSKSSAVSTKQQNNNYNNNNGSSINYNPLNQSNISPAIQEKFQNPSQNNNNISTFTNNNSSHFRNSSQTNDKYDILSSQAFKYQNEILQTNQELDCKLEELVILKAKYEEALNRVQSNMGSNKK